MAKSPNPSPGSSANPQAAMTWAEVFDVLDQSADSAAKAKQNHDELAKQLDRVSASAQSVQIGMQGLNAAFGGLSVISNVAHLALDGFSNAVQSIAGRIGGLVQLVNPGVMDQFQKSFSAFQAQLGVVFLPLLQGLGQLVQVVANAFAGLNGQGRAFILFLAGAAAGLTAGVTAGGIFLAMMGSVTGAMIASATAATLLGEGLTLATGGLAAIGAALGTVLLGITSASAGGLGGLAVASGSLQKFGDALKPFLDTLIGSFNRAGDAILPQLTASISLILPLIGRLFEELVQYLPPFALVLAEFASGILPEVLKQMITFTREMLPVAVILASMSVAAIRATSSILQFTVAIIDFAVRINPIIRLLNNFRPNATMGASGVAPPPVTGASYAGIEDLFKRSQEAALVGLAGQQDPFKQTMTDPAVVNQWTSAFTNTMLQAINGPMVSMVANAIRAAVLR